MSNVSSKQYVPMVTEPTTLNHSPVPVNKPLPVSHSADSVSQFLRDSSPAQKENNVTLNKESLEKLFAMFEFALKAMRSMLAGMGVLPRLPSELQAQPHVMPGPDPKAVADAGVKPRTAPHMQTGTQVKPGPQVKVMPNGPAPLALAPDGKHVAKPAMASTTDAAQNTKLPSEIKVTVQVQGCHCPHTGEEVAPQPGLNPRSDAQALSPALIVSDAGTQPSSPPASTTVLPKAGSRTTPDPTFPAPEERIVSPSGPSRGRSAERSAPNPSLRQRF